MPTDVAIPILPCRSLDETLAFYEKLGFTTDLRQERPAVYAIVRRGSLELHFFGFPEIDPFASYAGCYLRVEDVDPLFAELSVLGLPKQGIPRIDALADRPWGMREFAIVDPNGTLLRIGQRIAAATPA